MFSNDVAEGPCKTTQVLVLTGSVVTLPATALAVRKGVEIQNLGPNAIYVTVDGSTPTNTGTNGRRIDAGGGTWALNVGPAVAIKAIAATADQVAGAATMVTELS